ncbi:MAG: lysylphosphatidylglycerol synthase transmembrane domain-containing protein [Planctomycetota bacterium]
MTAAPTSGSGRGRRLLVLGIKLVLVALAFWVVSRKVSWGDELELRDGNVLAGRFLDEVEGDDGAVRIRLEDGEERLVPAASIARGGRHLGVAAAIREISPGWSGLAMAMIFAMNLLCIYRWQRLLAAQGITVGYGRAFRLTFMGFFWNNFMPGMTGGDLAKAVLIARDHPTKRSEAVSTVIVDRLVGMAVLALISAVAILFNFERFKEAGIGIFAVLLGCAVAGVCILSRRVRGTLRLNELMRRLPGSAILMKLDRAFLLYREHRGTLVLAALLSLASHVFNIGAVIAFGHDLGIDASALTYFATVPIVFITASIPLFPGGWGVRETAFLVAFAAAGVPAADEGRILLLSLLVGVAMMVWSLVGGIFLFGASPQEHVAFSAEEAERELEPEL